MTCVSVTAALHTGGCSMLLGTEEIGTQTGLTLQMNSEMQVCLHVVKINLVCSRNYICPPLCKNFNLCPNLKLR